MKSLPFKPDSVDTVVFCLSLMCKDYHLGVQQARRILKPGGSLLIVELTSRFIQKEAGFADEIKTFGFRLVKHEELKESFHFFKFRKSSIQPKSHATQRTLRPWMYKKR
eukprot:GHVN01046427.1.p1 GENE.GHVN01046427.1~~GHVN01046427.1.p1  ORF type:complete len:118 (-),score=10.17 GHVN01046427.1:94-420(-)